MNDARTQAIHDMTGKVCLVTGANTGIGRVTARELGRAGAHVFVACRSEERAMPVIEELLGESRRARADFLKLDLASLSSVRTAAKNFLDRDLPLHVLVNNAGVAGLRGLSADGFEMTFAVNHLGPFLFTCLLLDRLRASAPARIVNVSSKSHYGARGIDFDAVRAPTSATGLHEYGVSKLANVLFTKELARKLAGSGVTSCALHPGVVASDVWRHVPWPFRALMKLFMLSNDEGARTSLYCASAPELQNVSGQYYDSCTARTPNPIADDAELSAKLWQKSAEWSGQLAPP